MTQIKKFKNTIAILVCIAAISLTSCSQNPIDKALDQYETVVVKWENKKKNQTVGLSDMQEIQQDFLKMNINPEAIMQQGDVTEVQKKRAIELGQRLSNIIMP